MRVPCAAESAHTKCSKTAYDGKLNLTKSKDDVASKSIFYSVEHNVTLNDAGECVTEHITSCLDMDRRII